jgi:hypothetical protein
MRGETQAWGREREEEGVARVQPGRGGVVWGEDGEGRWLAALRVGDVGAEGSGLAIVLVGKRWWGQRHWCSCPPTRARWARRGAR